MKSFVVLCVVLVAGIRAAYVTLPPTQNEKANDNAYACIEESGVTSEALAEGRKGNILNDEGLKNSPIASLKTQTSSLVMGS